MANTVSISNALGVPFRASIKDKTDAIPAVDIDDSGPNKADNDYEYARRNLYDIIERGQEALDDMIDFAKQAQHPRAYEVVGTLINNLVDANQKLLHLSKQVKDINKKETEKEGPDKVQNNLFIGSTAELQKLLKGEE
jgi:Terminase DNA packaging enzyme